MGTARFIKRHRDWQGDAKVFKVDPPIDDEEGGTSEYVVVSAVVAYSGPETLIFASDEKGKPTTWRDLAGGGRGFMDHEAALFGAGYEIIDESNAVAE